MIESGGWRETIEQQPRLAALMGWVESVVSVDQIAPHLTGYLEKLAPALGSLAAVTQLLITVLMLFHFFRTSPLDRPVATLSGVTRHES